jgi:hypothetical protein
MIPKPHLSGDRRAMPNPPLQPLKPIKFRTVPGVGQQAAVKS